MIGPVFWLYVKYNIDIFCFRYMWSGLIVLLGIYLNVASKNDALRYTNILAFLKNILLQRHRTDQSFEQIV